MTSISRAKEWPLQLRLLPGMPDGISAVSVGGGWAKFIADHQLGDGAFLTFEVVADDCLVVALHCRGAHEDMEPFQRTGVDFTQVRGCGDIEHSQVVNPKPVLAAVLRQAHSSERPQFQKTIRKTHMKKHSSSRIVSAHPRCHQMSSLIH